MGLSHKKRKNKHRLTKTRQKQRYSGGVWPFGSKKVVPESSASAVPVKQNIPEELRMKANNDVQNWSGPKPTPTPTPKPKGFFSFFTRKQNTKVKPVNLTPERVIKTNWANRLAPAKSSFFTRKGKANNRLNTNRKPNNRPYKQSKNNTPDNYEPIDHAYERDMLFLYQTMKGINSFTNPRDLLSNKEKSELRKNVLKNMYNIKTDRFIRPTSDESYEKLINNLTRLDKKTFDTTLQTYEMEPPAGMVSNGLLPTPAARYINRLINPVLFTDDEFKRFTEKEKLHCTINVIFENDKTNMKQNICVLLGYSIPALFDGIDNNFSLFGSALYMVIHPYYHPDAAGQKYTKQYYDTSIDNERWFMADSEKFAKSKIIEDVMKNKGLQLIHPRLGTMFQIQLASLWNQGYFNPSVDPTDRIVILTLQKYAAIRRYTWTKNPSLASEVYEVNPKNIANELRAPYFTLPGKTFDSQEFFKEFRDNQLWAGGRVRYNSYSDPKLNKILPTNPDFNIIQMAKNVSEKSLNNYPLGGVNPVFPWFSPDTKRDEEEIPIPPLSEEEAAKEDAIRENAMKRNIGSKINVSKAIPFTNIEEAELSVPGLPSRKFIKPNTYWRNK
jgi:hypothetical protein